MRSKMAIFRLINNKTAKKPTTYLQGCPQGEYIWENWMKNYRSDLLVENLLIFKDAKYNIMMLFWLINCPFVDAIFVGSNPTQWHELFLFLRIGNKAKLWCYTIFREPTQDAMCHNLGEGRSNLGFFSLLSDM